MAEIIHQHFMGTLLLGEQSVNMHMDQVGKKCPSPFGFTLLQDMDQA